MSQPMSMNVDTCNRSSSENCASFLEAYSAATSWLAVVLIGASSDPYQQRVHSSDKV